MTKMKAVNIKNAWKSNNHEEIKPTRGNRARRGLWWTLVMLADQFLSCCFSWIFWAVVLTTVGPC